MRESNPRQKFWRLLCYRNTYPTEIGAPCGSRTHKILLLRQARMPVPSTAHCCLAPSVRFELTHTGLEDLLLYPNSEGKLVRTTGFEPVPKVWKTVMLPLHQVRIISAGALIHLATCRGPFGTVQGWIRTNDPGLFWCERRDSNPQKTRFKLVAYADSATLALFSFR